MCSVAVFCKNHEAKKQIHAKNLLWANLLSTMLQLIHLQKFKSYRYIISSYNLRNSNSASQIVQSTSPVVTRYLTQFVLDSVLGYGIIWEPIREPNPVPQAFVLYLLVRFPGCINPETRGFFQLNSVMISKSCLVHQVCGVKGVWCNYCLL